MDTDRRAGEDPDPVTPGPPSPPAAAPPRRGPGAEAGPDRGAQSTGQRLGFIAHLLVWGLGVLLLAILAGIQPALIVAVAWGIGLSVHGLFAVAAPLLRERWEGQAAAARGRELPGLDTPAPPSRAGVAPSLAPVTFASAPDALAPGGPPATARGGHRSARALEELAASVAHEIRNPVAAARSLVQQVRDDPSAPENGEYLTLALEELARVEQAVTHLLRFAREPAPTLVPVELGAVVTSALQSTEERLSASAARVERDLEPALAVYADPEQLRRVVINLVENALDALAAAPADREPRLRVAAGRDLAGRTLWLRVSDNGGGIPPTQRERLFSPFQTGKATGTGLGLAIARRMIEAHGGDIEVESSSAGTTFTVSLPAAEAPPAPTPASARVSGGMG